MSSQSKSPSTLTQVRAPGPSPWYLEVPWAAPTSAAGQWSWAPARGSAPSSPCPDFSRLLTPSGECALLLASHCYVCPLPEGRLLAWHVSPLAAGTAAAAARPPQITLVMLELDALQPLRDVAATARELRASKEWIGFQGGRPSTFTFRTDVGEGVHAIAPPDGFRALPELLVLADYGSEPSNLFDRNFRAIFAFDFVAGCVSVLPQRWFNEGAYDFGYQWITRVQRDPTTGRIVGDGIRLGCFRLDASGTQVEAWLD